MRIRRIQTGTANPNFRHGYAPRGKQPSEYGAYHNAKQRCLNPRNPQSDYYGKRGIKFLFKSFQQFLADIGKKPSPKHVLDRIDNDGHYKPGNVRWTTPSESTKNRRKPKLTAKKLRACRRNWKLAIRARWPTQ
jgi:hypothetical protein